MTEKFDYWCIVEIMGHQRYAGRVTEQTVGGAAFVRVDVPESDGRPAFTKLFGAGSIYSISPVAEEIARAVAQELRREPMSIYDLPDEIRERIRKPALGHVPGEHDDEFSDITDLDDEE